MGALRILRAAGGELLAQLSLYAQLARVEWEEERRRLQGMLLAGLFAFAFMLCLMLLFAALIMLIAWDGGYRVPALLGLIALYGAGLALACFWLKRFAARGRDAFAATREELAADIALLKSRS